MAEQERRTGRFVEYCEVQLFSQPDSAEVLRTLETLGPEPDARTRAMLGESTISHGGTRAVGEN